MSIESLHLKTPYLDLDKEFYSLVKPQPLHSVHLVAFSEDAAALIGLNASDAKSSEFVKLLNSEYMPQGAKPFAMCYSGHQFGHYNPWLGDGRAANLGKVGAWNLQLKGSGETYYSRDADGRAALGSSIREFLMSEAMHHLGIATTRAVGVIGSTTQIIRKEMQSAAVTLRLSSSWVRFGTFEYFYYMKEYEKLEALTEYVIEESYPHLKNDEDRFYKMFLEVTQRTAKLIAQWQGVGFNHGVMNSDNMSIEGLTIDYGPFAMLDDFNYGYVCNHTDKVGRYAYGEQPNIAYWNLSMLAKALTPLISKTKTQKVLDDFGAFIYPNAYVDVMREKLGLFEKLEEDVELIKELVGTLQDAYVDNTLFYRTLSHYEGDRGALYDIAMDPVVVDNWLKLYDKRLEKEKHSHTFRQKAMQRVNPKYVLKNYMLEKAIKLAKKDDFSMVEELLYIAKHPYDELLEYEHFAQETPQEHKNIGLSCSS